MLNNKIIDLNEKPIEVMTEEERDEYFMSLCDMTYAEFLEAYKDDTVEIITRDTFQNAKFWK